jgi:hypothetical protein
MPDVKVEIFRKTRELFRRRSSSSLIQANNPGAFRVNAEYEKRRTWYRRARGHVLYHLFPYDKSIWMSIKDPWWVAYTCVGIFPVIGQLWWLLLFLIKDKTNEHQLCQFIVGFKVAQFITLGILHMLLGVSAYIVCTIQGSLDTCRDSGPALHPWNAFFFLLQIILVWTAFFRLPYTDRPQESPQHPLVYRTKSMEVRERKIYHDVFGNEVHLNRGGYLMKFCGYETVSFAIIVALVTTVLWLPLDLWQRKALLYWIRTAYGLFSFPFLAFKIPLLASVLMHTRAMGYNELGDTVRAVKYRHG